mmetsp:Transcript_17842/g.27565  ORF Transcript_17842/g.27565 Transcript_17842/m.27565 type:complete len:201 (-) Transcript_17842:409-1011(-)
MLKCVTLSEEESPCVPHKDKGKGTSNSCGFSCRADGTLDIVLDVANFTDKYNDGDVGSLTEKLTDVEAARVVRNVFFVVAQIGEVCKNSVDVNQKNITSNSFKNKDDKPGIFGNNQLDKGQNNEKPSRDNANRFAVCSSVNHGSNNGHCECSHNSNKCSKKTEKRRRVQAIDFQSLWISCFVAFLIGATPLLKRICVSQS